MIYSICKDINGIIISNTLPHKLRYLDFTPYLNNKPFFIEIEGKSIKARAGNVNSSDGSVLIITTTSKYVNRLKSFRELCQTHLELLKSLNLTNNKLIDQKISQLDELIHNLTSLNTYTILELFALVPQQILSDNINKQTETVRNIIKEQPNITTKSILNLIKYSLAQKIEFSVFEKTIKKNPSIQKVSTNIRQTVLSVLQIFISDFEESGIELSMSTCEDRVNIDPESISVAVFYILENALKYSLPNSRLKIHYERKDDDLILKFDMLSIRIEEFEIDKICELEYRSKIADRLKISGNGIGMHKAKKLLTLCGCNLEVLPRKTNALRKHKKEIYEHNQINIVFPQSAKW